MAGRKRDLGEGESTEGGTRGPQRGESMEDGDDGEVADGAKGTTSEVGDEAGIFYFLEKVGCVWWCEAVRGEEGIRQAHGAVAV